MALNSGPTKNCLIEDPGKFSENLRNVLLQLFKKFLTEDGKVVKLSRHLDNKTF